MHRDLFNRREAVKILGTAAVGACVPLAVPLAVPVPAYGQQQSQPTAPPPKNRFSRMVHEFFVREVQKAYEQHTQAYARFTDA